jgi:hypothetical protein
MPKKRIIKNEDKSFTDTKTGLTWYDNLGMMSFGYMKQMIEFINKNENKKWRIPHLKELREIIKICDYKNKNFWIIEESKDPTWANVYDTNNNVYEKEIIIPAYVMLVSN